jgi:hypothetical protein
MGDSLLHSGVLPYLEWKISELKGNPKPLWLEEQRYRHLPHKPTCLEGPSKKGSGPSRPSAHDISRTAGYSTKFRTLGMIPLP